MMEKGHLIYAIELGVIIGIAINVLLRIKATSDLIQAVVNDTLKRDGKWDATKLTMFAAFMSVLWSFHYDTVKNGKVSAELFLVMACIATGVSIARAYSKKLNPDGKKDTDQPQP